MTFSLLAMPLLVFRTTVFSIIFYPTLSVFLLIGMSFKQDPVNRSLALWKKFVTFTIFLLRHTLHINVVVKGKENIPEGGALIASKHQSFFETIIFFKIFDDITMLYKRELEKLPLLSANLKKSGLIPVEREGGKETFLHLMKQLRDATEHKKKVVIFPEGTRTSIGAAPAYKTGIAHFYRHANVPCLPVALNSGYCWPRRSWVKFPGTITVVCLPPIPPGLDKKTFLARLEDDIETEAGKLMSQLKA